MLGPGLTAITGETGAGKTMLVEALELVVGGRAEPTIVRHGADEARVDARFVDGDARGGAQPGRAGRQAGRARTSTGARPRSRPSPTPRASSSTCTASTPTSTSCRRRANGGRSTPSASVDLGPLRAARARVTELDAELAALGGDERARARELDLARFQLAELDAAAHRRPGRGRRAARRGGHARRRRRAPRAGGAAHEMLAGDGGGPRRDRRRRRSTRATERRTGRPPSGSHEVLAELDDIARTVARRRRRHRRGPGAARGGPGPASAAARPVPQVRRRPRRRATLPRRDRRRVAELEGYDARAAGARLGRGATALEAERRAAAAVGAARRAAAPQFGAAVTARLRTLAMPHAELSVGVGDDGPGDDGRVPARGQPRLAAAAADQGVASGGELARTMLALRLVAVDDTRDRPRRRLDLVFDEVDAGIGGAAAAAVGARPGRGRPSAIRCSW